MPALNCWAFLQWWGREVTPFPTRERGGRERGFPPASNSELRRWCQQGAVVINGRKMNWNDEVQFPIQSFVLFPSGKARTTLW